MTRTIEQLEIIMPYKIEMQARTWQGHSWTQTWCHHRTSQALSKTRTKHWKQRSTKADRRRCRGEGSKCWTRARETTLSFATRVSNCPTCKSISWPMASDSTCLFLFKTKWTKFGQVLRLKSTCTRVLPKSMQMLSKTRSCRTCTRHKNFISERYKTSPKSCRSICKHLKKENMTETRNRIRTGAVNWKWRVIVTQEEVVASMIG